MKGIRSLSGKSHSFVLLACLGLAGCSSMMAHFGGGMSEELQQNGVSARARIQEIWDTGWTINDNPVIGMKVLVLPADRPAFEATIEKTTISRIATPQFQPGNTVPVRFDPGNPAIVAVDYGAELPAAAAPWDAERGRRSWASSRDRSPPTSRPTSSGSRASSSRTFSATRPPRSQASRSATCWWRSTVSRSRMSPPCRAS